MHLKYFSVLQMLQETALRDQFEDCVSSCLIISFPVITGKVETFFPKIWGLEMLMTENLYRSTFTFHTHFPQDHVLQELK